MLRSSSAAPKVGVALAALVPLGFAFVALRSDGDPPDEGQVATADAATATTAAAASSTGAPVQQIGLPVADESVAVAPYQAAPKAAAAPPTGTPAAPPAATGTSSGHGHGDGAAAAGGTEAKADKPTATTMAPAATPAPAAAPAADHGHGGDGAATTATTQPAASGGTTATQPPVTQPATTQPMGDHAMGDTAGGATETHGYSVHDFTNHVIATLGEQMLAPGQQQFGGYERNGNVITARSPITGLRPVAEQAIAQVKRAHPELTGAELESKIAQRLTDLNDWEDLRPKTQEKMMLLSGIDIASLREDEREMRINHLQHSPLPFGDITDVLTPDVTIDLGYTHTLDKEWTIAEDQGNGVFKITLVSNNDNGAHTGHILGSFRVQTPEGTSVRKAKRIGNEMVHNENNNDKLLLDEAVKKILYGETPLL